MNTFDVIQPSASPLDLQPARRLIVLVPETDTDSAVVARKIWELANALESRVQFLGLSKDAANESALRRQLVTLSAMVRDENIQVDSKIESGVNWLSVVKSEFREGDMIVCFEEQRSGITRRPLSQLLQTNLSVTVYVINGTLPHREDNRPRWLTNLIAWGGSLGIIAGFFWLQIKLGASSGAVADALLYISLFVEAGSIWAWNILFE